jgi:hypothetical protein
MHKYKSKMKEYEASLAQLQADLKAREEQEMREKEQYKELFDTFNQKYQELISETLRHIKRINSPRFIWGIGHNGDFDSRFESIRWPKSFSHYTLVGIRDYHNESRFPWVPCASCMHPALNKTYAIKNDVIWFEHKKQITKDFGSDPIPRFINSGSNIEQTIELLGSANVILTNSYHGAYWGTLLKKKVIVVGGWSSKFKWFKHQPLVIDKKEYWKDCVDSAKIYENALEECQQRTRDYWQRIQENL